MNGPFSYCSYKNSNIKYLGDAGLEFLSMGAFWARTGFGPKLKSHFGSKYFGPNSNQM